METPSPSDSPAVEVIKQQLASYDADLNRIDREIAALQVRREAIALMRKACGALVQSGTAISVTVAYPPNVEAGIKPAAQNDSARQKPAPTGFREAVRDVLRSSTTGLAPADVLAEMRRRGTDSTYKGTVDITTRLYNELSKMKKTGYLGRRAGKYYIMQGSLNGAP